MKLALVLNVSQEQNRCIPAEMFPQKDSLSDLEKQVIHCTRKSFKISNQWNPEENPFATANPGISQMPKNSQTYSPN